MKPLIEVSHISKRYQHIQALEDVSFAVNQGELFGIIIKSWLKIVKKSLEAISASLKN